MTYLYNKNVNVLNANTIVQTTNPFPVVVTGGNTNPQLINFPKGVVSAFGELSVIENSPDIQVDAVYGFNYDTMDINTFLGASAEANANTSLFSVTSGTTANASATLRSHRILRYRPGQGAIGRFTAMYTLSDSANNYGVANVTQRAGLVISGAAYVFGFSGEAANNKTKTFAVGHIYDGKPEIRTLTITTAPTGTQTANITLSGTSYTATIHSGSTSNAASEIAAALKVSAPEWHIDELANTVTFISFIAAPKNGTYSFSSTGAGTLAAGTITQNDAGVEPTRDWTYQADWNGDAIPDLDPSKLNVFQIDFRWLGSGVVRFFIEHPITGEFKMVHQQHWANLKTLPHVNNPSFRLGYVTTVSANGSSASATIKGASMMGAIQGKMIPTNYSKSWYTSVTHNFASGTTHHLLTIRNPFKVGSKFNSQQIQIDSLNMSLQGNDPSLVFVFINGNTSAPLIFQNTPNHVTYSDQIGPTMNTATDLPVCAFTVGVNGTSQFDLIPYRLVLTPGDTLSVAIRSTGVLSRAAAGIVWAQD